jgi:hypothetical protein
MARMLHPGPQERASPAEAGAELAKILEAIASGKA